ncbi:hypothetical protein PQ459_10210 [Chryseobacterium sp. KACC 21268]|nr:hypothetical protein PQ459_10210 [Chryseobacterium sp. KACC 21268]
MAQLGYTWYPQDWWTSETFKRLKRFPMVRYTIRELFDLMYKEGKPIKMNRDYLYDDFNIELSDAEYDKLLEFITITDDGLWWIDSIRKRINKAEAARQNGTKGGRPKSEKSIKNQAISETQKPSEKTQAQNPRNPPSERERESKREIESKKKVKDEVEIKNNDINNYYDIAKVSLKNNKRIIELAAMQNKIEIPKVVNLIDDFLIQKIAINERWHNDTKMNQNFLMWIPKILQAEKVNLKIQDNGPKDIFRNR